MDDLEQAISRQPPRSKGQVQHRGGCNSRSSTVIRDQRLALDSWVAAVWPRRSFASLLKRTIVVTTAASKVIQQQAANTIKSDFLM
ncbi:hypothetical protein [Bradyrhizobium symbiodeficiens]|uniref:hypothetical protein n=1 Tax=Bradyrhizobium symbiodeficiens TaxID=1404367 RepID=UPI00140FEE3B|nr:hypothetical protein [Bradyrhizobium symbiodeficiens]QIO98856.1 hypothetical protein HAU86_03125 [Bradyrhizobium symbiodeficiens]